MFPNPTCTISNYTIEPDSGLFNLYLSPEMPEETGLKRCLATAATIEEVVIAINLRFKEKVSPAGVEVVESYLESLHSAEELKTTIKSNISNDERQVYDLVIKQIMDKLYTDCIINNSPTHYTELTQDNIQSFINQSAYKMLREMLRAA